jgi:hypothetical protein
MGEIKSAIELAMERTKNLVMDDEEKIAFARKDREDRVRAIMRRFLEGMIEGAEFLHEYRDIKAEPSAKSALLVDLIVEEFKASGTNDRLFALLMLLGGEAGGGLEGEARSLERWFRDELAAREAGIRKRIIARLKDLGISGDAVEPNVREWEESQEAGREIGSLMRDRLHGWKEKLQAVRS